MKLPDMETVHEYVHYNPETGVFTRLKGRGRWRVGDVVGSINADGYVDISFGGFRVYGHRLAWFYMTGEWPPRIDHRNLDGGDNRFLNLRVATRAQNCMNTRSKRGGLKGAYPLPSGRFCSRIRLGRTDYYIGSFNTEQEAHAAYVARASVLFGDFARAS